MSKLTPDLEKQVVERVLSGGETLVSVRAWLKAEHDIDISNQALSKRIEKHRPATNNAELEPDESLAGLSDFDAHRARLSRLLKQVTDDAMADRSQVNIDKVSKVTAAWSRLEESHRAVNKPVDESVSDLASLLAKA